jgi:hypothetical protein
VTADILMGNLSLIICDVAGREVAFSNQELTDEQLRAVRERIDTLVSMNLKETHDTHK